MIAMQVQALLTELAMVEKEINWLEKRTRKLKMSLYREKQLHSELEMEQPQNHHQVRLHCGQQHQAEPHDPEQLSETLSNNQRKQLEEGSLSLSTGSEMESCSYSKSKGKKSIRIASIPSPPPYLLSV